MAIESVATATGSGSFAIDRPAGVEDGDVLIAIVAGREQSANWNPPSGWTSESPRAAAAGMTSEVFTRTAGASEPSSYFFTWTGTGGTPTVGTILRVSGAALPLDDFDGGFVGSASEVATLQLTTSASCLLLHCWVANNVGSLTIDPAVDEEVQVAQSTQVCLLVGSEIQSDAGATTPRTAEAASSTSWHRYTVAVELTNTAPNAPILTSPVDDQVVDLTGQIDLQGTFSDPDDGDELSAYEVEYRTQAGTGLVQPGQQSASGQTFTYSITANSLSAGGWEWRARTWDAQGAMGEWSAWEQFQAASPPSTPVITAPTDAGTIDSDPFTVTWTAPNQTHYQVRVLGDDAGSPDESDVLYDSGTVASTSARSLSVPFTTNNLDVHVQVRVQYGGLWSEWDSHAATVSYTPPETPTVVVRVNTADEPSTGWPAGAALAVDVTNPTGTTTVTHNEIRRQQSVDGEATWTDERGTVDAYNTVAVDVAEDGTYVDTRVASGTAYRYAAVAVGDNTTRTVGAWED